MKKESFTFFSKEIVSKYELVKMVSDIYDLNINIVPFETEISCNRSLASMKPLCNILVDKPMKKQIQEMKDFFSTT